MTFLRKLFRVNKEKQSDPSALLPLCHRSTNWLTEEIVPRPGHKSIQMHIFSAIDYQERIGLQFLKNKIKDSKSKTKKFLNERKKTDKIVVIQDQSQLKLFTSFMSQKIRARRKAEIHVDKLFVKAMREFLHLVKSSDLMTNGSSSTISITQKQLNFFFLSTMELVSREKELSSEEFENYINQFSGLLTKFKLALSRARSTETDSITSAVRVARHETI